MISSKVVFEKFPCLEKEIWAGGFWSDEYFVRTMENKVTADLIKCYTKYHRAEVHGNQLKLF